MPCTVHPYLFRIIVIVCKGRDPIGAKITMFYWLGHVVSAFANPAYVVGYCFRSQKLACKVVTSLMEKNWLENLYVQTF